MMKAADLPGWGVDPDLAHLKPDWAVHVEMIDTFPDDDDAVTDRAKLARYEDLYRTHGAWALPPVVCLDDGGWQIAGAHRMEAAFRVGIKRIPSFIVVTGSVAAERVPDCRLPLLM